MVSRVLFILLKHPKTREEREDEAFSRVLFILLKLLLLTLFYFGALISRVLFILLKPQTTNFSNP